MTGPSHLSNYEAALWWMNTADQIINDTGGEELPAAAVASHAALIRASVYSSLAIADAITTIGHTLADINEALHAPQQPPAGTCTAIIDTGFGTPTYEGCNHPHGHTGAHRATNNADIRWTDKSPNAGHINNPPNKHAGPCTCGHARGTHKQDFLCRNCDCDTYQEDTPSPDCTMNHPHPGHCTNPNDPCGDPNGKYPHQPCVLRHEHWDAHVDRDGNRWEQEPGQ